MPPGNIIITGHDNDLHGHFGDPATVTTIQKMLIFTRSGSLNPTLPILVIDEPETRFGLGLELVPVIISLSVPYVHKLPSALSASDFDVSIYSAFILASSVTCDGADLKDASSVLVNSLSAAIRTFFLAGGGIVGLAGGDNISYYDFLPVPAPNGLGFPPSSPYFQTPFGAAIDVPATFGDETHNFFNEPGVGGVDSQFQVVERCHDITTGEPTTIAILGSIYHYKNGFVDIIYSSDIPSTSCQSDLTSSVTDSSTTSCKATP